VARRTRAGGPHLTPATERLDQRPLSTVLLLRCCFFMAPPATYALALSVRHVTHCAAKRQKALTPDSYQSVSLRNYVLGSMLGLLLPLTFICAFTEKLLYVLGYEAATGGLGAAGEAATGAAGLGASGLAAASGLLGDVRAAAGAALDAAADGVGSLVVAGASAADAADLGAGEQMASAAMAASANLVV